MGPNTRGRSSEIQAAIERLDTYGYCLLEERIPAELADNLADWCLQLHADPKYKPHITAEKVLNAFDCRSYTHASPLYAESHPE